jgi:hypothetical protein
VITNKWIVHISQSPLDYAFHSLEQKRLMLDVYIFNPLSPKWQEKRAQASTYRYPRKRKIRKHKGKRKGKKISVTSNKFFPKPSDHEPCYEQYLEDLGSHKDHRFAYSHLLASGGIGLAAIS